MAETVPSSSQLIKYWDESATSKEFRHPIPEAVVERYFPKGAKVLDMGCGYGRLARHLYDLGFAVSATDTSPAMLEQAKKKAPECEFKNCRNELDWEDNTFDAAIIVTLLTSVPFDLEQRQIMSELRRVLKPGGCLFVSDLPLQWSLNYLDRYKNGYKRYGQYGVFDLDDGGTVRHHDLGYFTQLMSGFDCLELEAHEVITMNENSAQAIRYIGRCNK